MSEAQANPAGQFAFQRIYVKDISFEVPGAPEAFTAEWKPEVKLDLNTKNNKVSENTFEVVLSVTVTANNQGKVAFLAEVQQAGIFLINGMPAEQIQHLLGAYCPNVLFPYAREAISDLVNRGSFPQFLLAPVNFDALYAEALKRKAEDKKDIVEH
ncbi:MAG TPA: protein-export chaperone SecB [Pseudomonadales bacterium]